MKNKLIYIFIFLLSIFPTISIATQPTQPIITPTLEPIPANIEVEGFATEEEQILTAEMNEVASIEGLTPLYTTRIKPFTADGESIRMRSQQSLESDVVTVLYAKDEITVYAIYPSFVLAEFEGHVGFVIRTWVDEEMIPIDPVNTPPYGVELMSYVATVISDQTKVHYAPDANSEHFEILVNAGNKVSIHSFENGFAKVTYYRSYGYIDTNNLSDPIFVSPVLEPLSSETPIATYSSFFPYNTGDEGNEGRCLNIIRTCEKMTTTLDPGEVLDFNDDVGPYSRANGYHAAPVLIDGGSQLGYGGGTCQSSSTLYNTIRQLPGITILQRRPHGPGGARYLPLHQDAAVGTNSLNLVIRNDYDFPLHIVAETTGEGSINIQIYK